MSVDLSRNLLQTVLEWIEFHMGLRISESRLGDFEKSLRLAASQCGFEDPNEYVTTLVRGRPDPRDMSFIARFITVGETYFFRDPLSYQVLISSVLPSLLPSLEDGDRDRLRIWSAGCATGEEPYSIAMTAHSAFGNRARGRVEILGTDINPACIDVARKGAYRRWSFRDVPGFVKDKFFRMTADEKFMVNDEIKTMVNFKQLNLASEDYPSPLTGTENLDVIFCRNVLIYFSPERATEVLARFHRCLREGGYLFLAPSEIPHPAPDDFSIINLQGAIVLRKETITTPHEIHQVRIIKTNYSYFGSGSSTGAEFKSYESVVDITDFSQEETREDIVPISAEVLEDIDDLYAQGRYHEVIDELMKHPSAEEQPATALVLIARSYANLGNLEAAIDWCDRLIETDSVNPKWYYLKATIQQEKGLEKNAMTSLRQAIFLDQDYVLAHFFLGNIYRQHGSVDDSRRCFDNVVKLLKDVDQSETLPDSDGMTAGQLMSIVSSFGGD
ncbi:MAG: hypothetical protein KC777_22105 [Cyanobacteria bacterium HKST-UBA02]|nr:hypothetical protein [Cyanobacteria bacterium HKST-UBA02]